MLCLIRRLLQCNKQADAEDGGADISFAIVSSMCTCLYAWTWGLCAGLIEDLPGQQGHAHLWHSYNSVELMTELTKLFIDQDVNGAGFGISISGHRPIRSPLDARQRTKLQRQKTA